MSVAEREAFTPWPKLVSIFEKAVKGPTDLTPRQVALLAVYIGLDAPRRIKDYQMTVIGSEGSEMSDDVNWLVLDESGKPLSMTFHQFKTSNRYKTQRLDKLPPKVMQALKEYIDDAGLSEGDPLFGPRRVKPTHLALSRRW